MGTSRLCKHVETEAQVVNDEFVDDAADLEPIDEEERSEPATVGRRQKTD